MKYMWYLNGFSTAIFTTREKAEEYIKAEVEDLGVKLVNRKHATTFSVYDYAYPDGEIDVVWLSIIPVDPVYGVEEGEEEDD